MKMSKNPFIKFAIDEATISNDWLTRYEDQTKVQLRKHKNAAKVRKQLREA